MATPASIRLPLRLLGRRLSTTPTIPSTPPFLTPPTTSARQFSQQHALKDAKASKKAESSRRAESQSPDGSADGPKEKAIWKPGPPLREPTDSSTLKGARLPRAVQAVYLRPLRKQAQYGVPSCDLQLRSYSIRNLEFFADFAMRAAYYLGLPAYGPVPLPRIVERWTVPRASFVFKKSQENFERKTLRRLIQIKDGHPDTVRIWLAFLKKHQYYGIGMKANVWAYEGLDVAKDMEAQLENIKEEADETWQRLGLNADKATAEKVMEFINTEEHRAASGTRAPQSVVKPTPL